MKIEGLNITDQINTQYRDYALYVIQGRGIPNFYDSLTPVQRLVLINAPSKFSKTIGLVGEVIKTGLYHHGDSSLASAINKLARPFGCSERILLGDGYFGTPVNPEASAARYTSVKIDPSIKSILEKNWAINQKNAAGGYDWINIETPIGLFTHIVGIAVGYRSNILPRKEEDIEAYLKGENKLLKPHFKGFKGKITRNRKLKSAWTIEGEVKVDHNKKTIWIGDLPPLIRYDSYLKRLYNRIDGEIGTIRVANNSSTSVNLTISYRGNNWEDFSDWAIRSTKIIAAENIVFVRNGAVVEYEDISHYLKEFRVHKEGVILRKMKHDLKVMSEELEFLEAKLKFLKFMSAKKRKEAEVKKWLMVYRPIIRRRLEGIKAVNLTDEHIKQTEEDIKTIKKEIGIQRRVIEKQNKNYKSLSKKIKWKGHIIEESVVFGEEEIDSIDGIEIWQGEDSEEETETSEEI